MFNILNKKGSVYLGLIVSVLIVVLFFFGSFYFFNNGLKNNPESKDLDVGDNLIDTLNNAQNNIDKINKTVQKENNVLDEFNLKKNDFEKWHLLQRKNENFELKYPRGWYYTVKRKSVKDLGYELMIGFGSNTDVWNQDPPYLIELIQAPSDFKTEMEDYFREVNLQNKKYIIKSVEKKYDFYVDQMIKTLKLIN